MMTFKKIISCIFFITVTLARGQDTPLTDSLEAVLKTQKQDSTRVRTLNALANEYINSNLEKSEAYSLASVKLATLLKFYPGRSSAYATLGNISANKGGNKDALKYYFLAAKDKEHSYDTKGLATVYNNTGTVYKDMSDYETAMTYYKRSLQLRLALKDQKGIADCYNNMGNVYRSTSRYTEALDAFNKALSIRERIRDTMGIAFALSNIGGIYDDRADFVSALKNNYRSAELLEKIKKKNPLIRVYNNISITNKNLKNYPEALKYGKLSLALSEETGNKNFRVNTYENLGNVYSALKNYKEGQINFEKGMELAKASGRKEQEGAICGGLALCYENDGQYDKAEIYFKKAMRLAEETGIERSIARFSIKLAGFYARQGKNELVKPLIESCLNITKKNGLKNDLKKTYKAAAVFYDNLHDTANSFLYYKLYSDLSDSLYSDDVVQKFAEQQTLYETKKKETEIKILKQQEEIAALKMEEQQLLLEKRKYLLFACLAFILFLSIGAWFYYSRQRIKAVQKQEAMVREAEENERMRLAKDIHDDLGSGLSKIKILSEIISAKSGDNPELRSGINSVSGIAVQLVENMRDLIWALNPENTTLGSLIARMREYSSDYLNDFPIDLKFKIDEHFSDRKITKEAHRNIFFILKESLQNLVKHSEASAVMVELNIGTTDFHLSIRDNGKGMDENPGNGNGLRNIRQRAENLGGAFSITSQKGSGLDITLVIPLLNIGMA